MNRGPRPGDDPGKRGTARLDRAGFTLLSLLLAAPVLWVHHPPMVDLPSHAALIAVMDAWNDGGFGYTRLFELHLATPYLLAYGLVWLVARVTSVLWATKIVVAASLVALPWAARHLLARVGTPTHWAWLVFPTAFGYSFHWGFLTFLVATPLVLLFVAHYLSFTRRPGLRRGVVAGLFLVLLALCHVVAAGLAGLVCLGLLFPHRRSPRDLVLRCLPFVPAALLAVGWLALFLGGDARLESWMPVSESLPRRLFRLPGALLGHGGRLPHSVAGFLLAALPFLLGARPARRLHRWWPFVLCLLLHLLWPEMLFGTAQVGQRFAVFLLPFLLFACEPGAPRRGRRLIPFAVAAGLLLATWPAFHAWERETASFRAVVDEMAPHGRILSLVFWPWSEHSPAPVYLHYPSWYAVEKGGVVEFSLAMFDHLPVRYRPGEAPPFHLEFPWTPQDFRWQEHGGERYDAFLLRAPADAGSVLFPSGRVELAAQRGLWWLYRPTLYRPTSVRPVSARPMPRRTCSTRTSSSNGFCRKPTTPSPRLSSGFSSSW